MTISRGAFCAAPRSLVSPRVYFWSNSTHQCCWRGWAHSWQCCRPQVPSHPCPPRQESEADGLLLCHPCFQAGPSSLAVPTRRARATCASARHTCSSSRMTATAPVTLPQHQRLRQRQRTGAESASLALVTPSPAPCPTQHHVPAFPNAQLWAQIVDFCQVAWGQELVKSYMALYMQEMDL